MAQRVFADRRGQPDFCGLESLFEFTNADGALTRTNCGQAAAATFLTHHGKLRGEELPAEVMTALERNFPPDQLFGLFGTGRTQVERICRAHQLPLAEIQGDDLLRDCLRQRRPVIVMLGVTAGQFFGRINLPGGHWMVAFGCDSESIYLSNWGQISWADFQKGWRAPVSRLINMNGRGLIA